MTWATVLATGSGELCVRLSIEGLGTEFVSDPGMEQTTVDGRVRVCTLPAMGKGIVIDESVNIPEAKLEGRGVSIQIRETADHAIARVFAWRPDVEHYITSTVATDDTTIYLLSTNGLAAGDVVHIGTEAIEIGSVTATTLEGVQRANWGTIAQRHQSNDGRTPLRMLHNRPLRIRGRRARIYAYGDGDDLQGDGTLIWLGTVTSDPRCDDAGSRWQVQLSSIADRLNGKLGGELADPVRPRGIYYSYAAPVLVLVGETGTQLTGGFFTGFYETQDAFVAALNAWLEPIIAAAGLTSTWRAIVLPDGRWTIEATVATGITLIDIVIVSPVDGATAVGRLSTATSSLGNLQAVSAGQVVRPVWDPAAGPAGARTVPRGTFGIPKYESLDPLQSELFTTFPAERIYVDQAVRASWTDIVSKWPADGTNEGEEGPQRLLAKDITNNSIDLEIGRGVAHVYTSEIVPEFNPSSELASGTLADFRDALVALGPEYANLGVAPFITSEDLADWSAVVEQYATTTLLRNRRWTLATSVDLEEVIANECRLHQLYPIIDADGKIGLAPILVANETTLEITTLDEELVSVGWSSMERGGQTINRVLLKSGYDAREDDWTGRTIEVVEYTSYAQDHEDRVLTVEPRSRCSQPSTEAKITHADVRDSFIPMFSIFGWPHDFITVNVSWKHFDLRLGDYVSFSAEHLPDFRFGMRPMEDVVGVVVGRKWALGDAHGQLRLLVSWANVAGYSPTARIASQTNTSGNTWELLITQTGAAGPSVGLYAPEGTTPEQHFAVGDRVRVTKYDSESAGAILGSVTAVSTIAHTITVTFDSAWNPASHPTWELIFAPYDLEETHEAQERYAAIANSAARLVPDSGNPDDTNNARTFAP